MEDIILHSIGHYSNFNLARKVYQRLIDSLDVSNVVHVRDRRKVEAMIYSNRIKDGTVNVKICQRDGGELSGEQFIDELTAIYIALLEDSDDLSIIKYMNEAVTTAQKEYLENRNNYFDSRKGKK